MDNKSSVELKSVTKTFIRFNSPGERLIAATLPKFSANLKTLKALSEVNLHVAKGEIVGIIGLNGSGKSTLLKVIAGVLQPSSGMVKTSGKLVALLELGAGFNPEFSGRENIFFYGASLGLSREEIAEKFSKIVNFAELSEFIDQPLKTYSSGMKARLAFSTAMEVQADILILDEVLAVGDALFKRKCYARLSELFNSGITIFYVSHSMDSIAQLCTKAVLMHKGCLLAYGSPEMVQKSYFKLQTSLELVDKGPHELAEDKSTVQLQKGVNTDTFGEKNVLLSDFQLLDGDGQKIKQNLKIMQNVVFQYRATFLDNFENVSFGCQIINESGQMLSAGAMHHTNTFLETVERGRYIVDIEMRLPLLNGTYFLFAGVAQSESGEIKFLGRRTDALKFTVDYSQTASRGLVESEFVFNMRKLK